MSFTYYLDIHFVFWYLKDLLLCLLLDPLEHQSLLKNLCCDFGVRFFFIDYSTWFNFYFWKDTFGENSLVLGFWTSFINVWCMYYFLNISFICLFFLERWVVTPFTCWVNSLPVFHISLLCSSFFYVSTNHSYTFLRDVLYSNPLTFVPVVIPL